MKLVQRERERERAAIRKHTLLLQQLTQRQTFEKKLLDSISARLWIEAKFSARADIIAL